MDLEKADGIDTQLVKLGYRCLHRGDDAANYLRNDERVDLRLFEREPLLDELLQEIN